MTFNLKLITQLITQPNPTDNTMALAMGNGKWLILNPNLFRTPSSESVSSPTGKQGKAQVMMMMMMAITTIMIVLMMMMKMMMREKQPHSNTGKYTDLKRV